jgi:hypothetical protein
MAILAWGELEEGCGKEAGALGGSIKERYSVLRCAAVFGGNGM